jgi:hypothetical protein
VEGASNGVMSGAEARLHQNSLHKASLRKARQRKPSPEGKSSSSLELGFLTFGTPPFLTVMPAEAGIQSGGSGGCSPWALAFAGATKKDAGGHRSGDSWRP